MDSRERGFVKLRCSDLANLEKVFMAQSFLLKPRDVSVG